jgi:hypothetical protein
MVLLKGKVMNCGNAVNCGRWDEALAEDYFCILLAPQEDPTALCDTWRNTNLRRRQSTNAELWQVSDKHNFSRLWTPNTAKYIEANKGRRATAVLQSHSRYAGTLCRHFGISLEQGCTNYTETLKASENSRRQKGDIKEVPHWRQTDIRRHRTKFSGSVFVHPCPRIYS